MTRPTIGKATAILIFALRCLASSLGNMHSSCPRTRRGHPGYSLTDSETGCAGHKSRRNCSKRQYEFDNSALHEGLQKLQHSQARHEIRRFMECVFRSAGVNSLSSYPGFPPPPMLGGFLSRAKRSYFGLLCLPNRIPNLRKCSPRRDVSDPAQGVCCHSASSTSQSTGISPKPQGISETPEAEIHDSFGADP